MEASGTRAAETRLNRLLNLILETAVETLDFDAATVTTRHGRDGFSTVAATDHRMISVDDAQYESREGPCVEVLDSDESIFLPEVAEGADRWADFARTAQHLGVVSTLSLRIPTDVDHVAASLNLYAKRRLDLGEREIHAATSYAEQLAATMHSAEAYRATAKLAADMAEAMRSRAVIEQAKGILMADGGISADEAFDRLRRTSQKVNRKLRDVAQELVTERASRR
jgi:GAF domain-containing protein